MKISKDHFPYTTWLKWELEYRKTEMKIFIFMSMIILIIVIFIFLNIYIFK